jgi:hypothetical protein
MKFALHFGNIAFSDPEGARRLVRLAKAAGFDSVFAVEHVVFPDNYTSVYPYAPGGRLPGGPSTKFPDPLIWLTWVAAATTRLRFMTAVMILPQRNPLAALYLHLLEKVCHADVVKQSTARKSLDLGLRNYSREDLEAARRAGEMLHINVLGLVTIAQDVTPDLARATIASVSVLGALHATPAVKAALADRIG